MEANALTGGLMARLIEEKTGEKYALHDVLRWANGERMPRPEAAQAIQDATDGQVTIMDLHRVRLARLRAEAEASVAEEEAL